MVPPGAGPGMRGAVPFGPGSGHWSQAGDPCPGGVIRLWFVDSELRTLEAFEPRDGHCFLLDMVSEDARVSLPPYDPIGFSPGALWLAARVPDRKKGAEAKPVEVPFHPDG